jgi:F-type H+-transporting ATPase subunit gamma
MKMVAAARLRRAEERACAARPYAERLQGFMDVLFTDSDSVPHPLAEPHPTVKRVGLLLITSDRGLCGAYNTNIIRQAQKFVNDHGNDNTSLFLVGRKGFDYFRRRQGNIVKPFIGLDPALVYREIKDISDTVANAFLEGQVDQVSLAYSRYVSPAVCRPIVLPLLPLAAKPEPEGKPGEDEKKKDQVDFIFQPSPQAILEDLFPKYFHTKLVLALAESFASEQGQRMVAMTTATDNAAEMIDKLTLYYNKVRQAAITKEISEIVGGAEALK